MPLRSYDPTIARWNRVDPITHLTISTYNAFGNNPVYYNDPSGGSHHEIREGRMVNSRDYRNDGNSSGNVSYNWNTGQYENGGGNAVGFGTAISSIGVSMSDTNRSGMSGLAMLSGAMRSLGFRSFSNITIPKNTVNTEELDMLGIEEYIQSYPGKIDFKNVKDEEVFLEQVIEWFGFVNKFGTKSNIHPASIIDFYSESQNEKSWYQSLFDEVMGDDFVDVNIYDGSGNWVRIGYYNHIQKHADIYSASSVDFEGVPNVLNKYRISIRSHDKGGGKPQAILFMHFSGKNRSFYDRIEKKINSYKYKGIQLIPYKKQ